MGQNPKHKRARIDLYQRVTDKIIAELEAGRASWAQPLGGGGSCKRRHRSARQRPYGPHLFRYQYSVALGHGH